MDYDAMTHSKELIIAAEELLSTFFQKKVYISNVVQLSEPERRNLILRLELENPSDNMPATIILKKTATENQGESEQEQMSRFAHDWAGIEFLSEVGGHHAPYFYGGSLAFHFILIEDLGLTHPSLVGPLTRAHTLSNELEAIEALKSYMKRVGQMHADSYGKTQRFNKILESLYPKVLRFHYLKEQDISKLLIHFQSLTHVHSKALEQEIELIYKTMASSKHYQVLLHGDICPDNVFYTDNEVRLFDFEYGDIGHALIDGVYLRMSMPSCWCSKTVPNHILEQMENLYRNELRKKIPDANDDKYFQEALVNACGYWLIWNLSRWLDELLEHEWVCPSGPVDKDSMWDPQKNGFRARILSRLEAFITCASHAGYYPNLCQAARHLLASLNTKWPNTKEMDLFPVFCTKVI